MEDVRKKRIAFVSSCILNVNNKVRELARYPGSSVPILQLLQKYDIGIQQMDCPETLFLGVNRWSATKNLYDTPAYRRHCRELASRQMDYVESYLQAGYDIVAFLWINGSPSCGCNITCFDEKWGGTPMDMGDASTFVKGSGVFVEEMSREIFDRRIEMPYFLGLDLEDETIPLERTYQILEDFLKKKYR